MDIIISYPNFQSINFGKSLSICQRLFAIFMWKDIIMLSVWLRFLKLELVSLHVTKAATEEFSWREERLDVLSASRFSYSLLHSIFYVECKSIMRGGCTTIMS